MPRIRKFTNKVYVGGRYDASLGAKFMALSRANGVSVNEGLRRLMVNAILEGRIPGIEAMDLEAREQAKWGHEAVPTFDGNPPPNTGPGLKSRGGRKQAPVPPVQ